MKYQVKKKGEPYMKIIPPSVSILSRLDRTEMLKAIELAGRTCYKSEDKITAESAAGFVKRLIKSGHEAMIEHASISARFICDRGVSHEIVRHRLFSFAQESTRYVKYTDGLMEFIDPVIYDTHEEAYTIWKEACEYAEASYLRLMTRHKDKAENARSVLPNSLKTEIVVTGNIREWRHFFKLRLAMSAHPQMRQVARLAYEQIRNTVPELFEDLDDIYNADKFFTARIPAEN